MRRLCIAALARRRRAVALASFFALVPFVGLTAQRTPQDTTRRASPSAAHTWLAIRASVRRVTRYPAPIVSYNSPLPTSPPPALLPGDDSPSGRGIRPLAPFRPPPATATQRPAARTPATTRALLFACFENSGSLIDHVFLVSYH